MVENSDTMVLRSFHLPQGMDDELRGLAFTLRCAKADVQRFFIDQGMKDLAERYGDWRSWGPDVVGRVAQAVQAGGGSQSVREGIRRDIDRLGVRSGLEDLLAQVPTSDIASKMGVDEGEVNNAVEVLVPVLVGGLRENAQDPDHASEIESAADSQAGLLDGGVSVDQVDQQEGQQAIATIFGGNDAAQVANAVVGGGGGNSDLLRQLLPILAQIVLAYVGKQLTGKGGGAAKEAAGGGALNDVLGSMLGGMGDNESLGTMPGNALDS